MKKMTGDAEKTQGDDADEKMDDADAQGPIGGLEEAGGPSAGGPSAGGEAELMT